MMPPVLASPKALVAALKSPQLAPPSARAVRVCGLTRTPRIRDRSMTTPLSTVPKPEADAVPPARLSVHGQQRRRGRRAVLHRRAWRQARVRGRGNGCAGGDGRADGWPATCAAHRPPRGRTSDLHLSRRKPESGCRRLEEARIERREPARDPDGPVFVLCPAERPPHRFLRSFAP